MTTRLKGRHRGLHMLGGAESLAFNAYKQRPSFETDLCTGTTWKKTHKAAVQFPPGHPRNTTFARMYLPAFAFLDRLPNAATGPAKPNTDTGLANCRSSRKKVSGENLEHDREETEV